MTIRVLIADDQDMVRAGFRMILDATPGMEVVGEADSGHAAVAAALELRPDVCLFDIRMPHLDGVEATRRVVDEGGVDGPRVVVVTRPTTTRGVVATQPSSSRCVPARNRSVSTGPSSSGLTLRWSMWVRFSASARAASPRSTGAGSPR